MDDGVNGQKVKYKGSKFSKVTNGNGVDYWRRTSHIERPEGGDDCLE